MEVHFILQQNFRQSVCVPWCEAPTGAHDRVLCLSLRTDTVYFVLVCCLWRKKRPIRFCTEQVRVTLQMTVSGPLFVSRPCWGSDKILGSNWILLSVSAGKGIRTSVQAFPWLQITFCTSHTYGSAFVVLHTYVGDSISKLQIQVATYVFELSEGNCHR
jgi:hypothetical protein